MAASLPDMTDETARTLFTEGAILLLLDVPPGTEFGIDCSCWTTGDRFRGVKMIPPGVHFVYYSAVSRLGETAPRRGFFHNFARQEFLIKKWDKYEEDISDDYEATEEEICRHKADLHILDKHLGPYPYDTYKKWVSLSNFITNDVIERLQPLSGRIVSATELEPLAGSESGSRPAVELDKHQMPKMIAKAGTEVRFTQISKRSYPVGASPTEVTKHNMDRSYQLALILTNELGERPELVLGEVQFAFICFLLGNVYDGFEQWKKLVTLLCFCEDAVRSYPVLFTDFISILFHQVHEIPKDFFVDIVSRNNFLTTTLQAFFATLDSAGVSPELKEKGKKFQKHLVKRFKWDFSSEPDDCLPVIVP